MAYLLDTGLLVHAIRETQAFRAIDSQLKLIAGGFRPLVSIISQGEILGLARKNNWGDKKTSHLGAVLESVVILPLDRASITRTYAELEKQNSAGGLNLGQNDLWIAATSLEFGLTLLTFDADFDRSPNSVRFIRFDQDTGMEISRRLDQ